MNLLCFCDNNIFIISFAVILAVSSVAAELGFEHIEQLDSIQSSS